VAVWVAAPCLIVGEHAVSNFRVEVCRVRLYTQVGKEGIRNMSKPLGRVGKKTAVLRTTGLFSSQEGNKIMRKGAPMSESQYYGSRFHF
jgi:hypothetical protein